MCSPANIFSRYFLHIFAHFPSFRKIQPYPQSWWEIACNEFGPQNQQGPWKINGGVFRKLQRPPLPIQESLELARELFSSRLGFYNNNNRGEGTGQSEVKGLWGIVKKLKTMNMDTCRGLICNMDIIWIKKFMNFDYKYVVSINMNTSTVVFFVFVFSQSLLFLKDGVLTSHSAMVFQLVPSWWNGSNHHTALKFNMEPNNQGGWLTCCVSFSKWILVHFFSLLNFAVRFLHPRAVFLKRHRFIDPLKVVWQMFVVNCWHWPLWQRCTGATVKSQRRFKRRICVEFFLQVGGVS